MAGQADHEHERRQAVVLAGPPGPDPEELVPESDGSLFVLSGEVTFTFEKDERVKPMIKAGSQSFEAKKPP